MEMTEKDARISEQAKLPEDNSILGTGEERSLAVRESANDDQATPQPRVASLDSPTEIDVPVDSSPSQEAVTDAPASEEPLRKRDWL